MVAVNVVAVAVLPYWLQPVRPDAKAGFVVTTLPGQAWPKLLMLNANSAAVSVSRSLFMSDIVRYFGKLTKNHSCTAPMKLNIYRKLYCLNKYVDTP